MKPETEATAIGPAAEGAPAPRRRSYACPRLEVLGDIRDLTLGGTPGTGDSGNPGLEDPPLPP